MNTPRERSESCLKPVPGQVPATIAEAPLCWSSDALLRGQQVVYIEHKGATYQLRLTRQDKLILTK